MKPVCVTIKLQLTTFINRAGTTKTWFANIGWRCLHRSIAVTNATSLRRKTCGSSGTNAWDHEIAQWSKNVQTTWVTTFKFKHLHLCLMFSIFKSESLNLGTDLAKSSQGAGAILLQSNPKSLPNSQFNGLCLVCAFYWTSAQKHVRFWWQKLRKIELNKDTTKLNSTLDMSHNMI